MNMNTKGVFCVFLALMVLNNCEATIEKLKWLLGGANTGNTNYYGTNNGYGGGYGYNSRYPSYSGYNYGGGENLVKVIKVSISPAATYSTGGYYGNGYSGGYGNYGGSYSGGYGGYGNGGGGYSYPASSYPASTYPASTYPNGFVPMMGVSSLGYGTPGYVGGYGNAPAVYGAGRGYGYGGSFGLGYPGAFT